MLHKLAVYWTSVIELHDLFVALISATEVLDETLGLIHRVAEVGHDRR